MSRDLHELRWRQALPVHKREALGVADLVFGNQRRVSEWWLKKYGGLVGGVEFYFLADDGTLEQLC